MEEILYSKKTNPTYENFIAICPYCDFKNIFNRATDLKDTNPIGFKTVKCLSEKCGKSFNINGDLVSPAYQMLIFDCYDLLKEKKYSYCILNLAQAFEVFFSLYLRIKLIYKPLAIQRGKTRVNELNEIIKFLYEAIKKYPYLKIRNIFINTVLSNQSNNSLEGSKTFIENIKNLTTEPENNLIENISDKKLEPLLIKLKNSKIHELRNEVVHKYAYRPTLEEVEKAINETREIVLGLSARLDAKYDDINWYLSRV